jgi:hypothetical protein
LWYDGGSGKRLKKGESEMLERVHQHITDELQQGARTDTIFVVTAVLFNLIVLGVNSAVANEPGMPNDLILVVLILMVLIINAISIAALVFGRSTRNKLLSGLLAMYRDNDVDRYYDPALLTNYNKRYLLFAGVILALGVTSIVVPLIVRFA